MPQAGWIYRRTPDVAVAIAVEMIRAEATKGMAVVWDVLVRAKHEHGHFIAMSAYDQFEHWRRDISGNDEQAHALLALG
jgi:hypothetical protein